MIPALFYLFLFLIFGLVALALWQMSRGEDLSRPL